MERLAERYLELYAQVVDRVPGLSAGHGGCHGRTGAGAAGAGIL